MITNRIFRIAQIDVTNLLSHNVMFSYVDHISDVVDPFGRSLRFCHLEFDIEAISNG